MKYIAPDYYKKFKCIADQCKHSCCVGWEIDVDKDTFNKYKSVKGDFGERLNESIEIIDNAPCFKLDYNERCPFLNENNLCDIILNLGEDYLCQICNDHPRFRNFYEGATEIGIGLCCEAAAELIITQTESMKLEVIGEDDIDDTYYQDEIEFLSFRSELFKILQNRSNAVDRRVNEFLNKCNAQYTELSSTDIADFLLSLERLDNKWTDILNEVKQSADFSNTVLPPYFEIAAEQLLLYFTYRHLSGYLDDGRLSQRAGFITFSYKTIKILCKYHLNRYGTLSYDDIAEYARLYSSEIEYSEENTETILEKLS